MVDEAAVGKRERRARVVRPGDVGAVEGGGQDLGVMLALGVAPRPEVQSVKRHRPWLHCLEQLRVGDAIRALLQPEVVGAQGAVQPGEQLGAAR